jgi:hypothetical protein
VIKEKARLPSDGEPLLTKQQRYEEKFVLFVCIDLLNELVYCL